MSDQSGTVTAVDRDRQTGSVALAGMTGSGRPTLLLNASFLDVLPQVQPSLDAAGLSCITPPELQALPASERRAWIASAEVVFGPGPFTREDIVEAHRLKVIALASSGYESVDVATATERGIVVTYAPTQMGTDSVADLTFGLILDVAREIAKSDHRLKSGVWQRPLGAMVWGKTLGVIGFGRIGSAVARRARGFNMRVLTQPHNATNPLAVELGVESVPLEELLQRSDVVSVHSRLNPATRHFLGRAQLRQMKETAYLINTARADIIDPDALSEALAQGWIAGAGLDVFHGEPNTDNPILSFPNVVATPHLGNRTREGVIDVVECSVRCAQSVLRRERPEFVVNPEVYEQGVR